MVLKRSSQLTIRVADPTDFKAISRLHDDSWAVHTRLTMDDVRVKLKDYVAIVIEDATAMRGFFMVELHPPHSSLLVTAIIHDNNTIASMLDLAFPALEESLRQRSVIRLLQIGDTKWLTRELPFYGFTTRGQIITFEWRTRPLPTLPTNPHLKIRAAHISDLPSLMALDALAFGPDWHKPRLSFRDALGKAASFLVGVIDDRVVAYEWCDQFGNHAHLTRLATHPHFQGQGIGALMLHRAMQSLVAQGVTTVSLNTQTDNLTSQRLYLRFGFEQTEQITQVYQKDIRRHQLSN